MLVYIKSRYRQYVKSRKYKTEQPDASVIHDGLTRLPSRTEIDLEALANYDADTGGKTLTTTESKECDSDSFNTSYSLIN